MDATKLFGFHGRIGRGEYWALSILFYAVLFVGVALGSLVNGGVGVVAVLVLLTIFVVGQLATQTKRWHDRNKSGWWALIGLVPFIGPLWSFIELGFLAGTSGSNLYGYPSSGSPFGSDQEFASHQEVLPINRY
jgi:uncharacterized membrane protein YhaH (DUF805 family)